MRLALVFAFCFGFASCSTRQQTARVVPPAPSFSSSLDRQVKNALDAGDGDFELSRSRERLLSHPDDLAARLDLGRAYARRGYPELALDHYRLALERVPSSSSAALLLAKALQAVGHASEAAASLGAFVAANPQTSPELYSWLGIFRDDSGDWKGGESAHRQALARAAASRQDQDYLHNNLGYSLLKQGRKEESAAEFRRALQLNPHSEIARDNLGMALTDNPREAILYWQSLNEPASAHSNLAALLIEQGKYREARRELEIALQYNRSNPAALANLKLLSDLDGKPVTVPVPPAPRSFWSRARSGWRRLWEKPPATTQSTVETASQTKELNQ